MRKMGNVEILSFLAQRRNGGTHTEADLREFARLAGSGQIPDYQLAAWLMAAFLKPLTSSETAWLTLGMADSGERLSLEGLPHPWVDKHSTGGVGDKTTIVLLPILAACGLTIVKMSGRGLGITGGTVDKLASVPGFRTDLSPEEMKAQAAACGIGFSGQTPNLAPADKVLYSLRDATSTVESVPLIVSSILSKKIAGGAETIVLDVKCGSGAFMKDLEHAQALCKALMETGKRCGLNVHASVTDMDIPLGRSIGNALEIKEAIEVLEGAPGRFRDLCLALAGETLAACGKADSFEEGIGLAKSALNSGAAKDKLDAWFSAQGAVLPVALPRATNIVSLEAEAGMEGWVERIDAGRVGQLVLEMGGGRHAKDDVIDPRVGVWIHRHVGEKAEGVLADLHLRDEEPRKAEFLDRLKQAFTIKASKPASRSLFL